jgi:ribosomal protein L11 methyltransferase
LFPDGLLLVPQPGGVTRLEGWLKAGRRSLAPADAERLRGLGARRLRCRLQAPPEYSARPHGRFPVLRLGRFLVTPSSLAPSFKAPPRAARIILVQGQAFGSGRHESTRLMLRVIEDIRPRAQDVLDVGAGSGILGFACLHLGAARVRCVELESAACAELRRNRELNAVAPRRMPVRCAAFPTSELRGRVHALVLANLVTPLLLELMGELRSAVAPGGTLLCGGIHGPGEAAQVFAAARRAGLRLERRSALRSWNVLRFKRP